VKIAITAVAHAKDRFEEIDQDARNTSTQAPEIFQFQFQA
jgi:hypothetical protein